jgi:hypothetical protein
MNNEKKNKIIKLIKDNCKIINNDEYDDNEFVHYKKSTIYGKIPLEENNIINIYHNEFSYVNFSSTDILYQKVYDKLVKELGQKTLFEKINV